MLEDTRKKQRPFTFFLKFVLFVASMGIRYSAPGPTAVGRVYWRRTVTATPGKLAQGVPREGPGDGTQTGRAQRGTPTARRYRNRQRQTTGLRQGAAPCGIVDPNQAARATTLLSAAHADRPRLWIKGGAGVFQAGHPYLPAPAPMDRAGMP